MDTNSALNTKIKTRGGHLMPGFIGIAHLCSVLMVIGCLDLAYRLVVSETFMPMLHASLVEEKYQSILRQAAIARRAAFP